MGEFAITVEGLRKSFKGFEVLRGVDMQIPKGEIYCLLGSNGAGKTTTVRILATLLSPDEGKITICGHNLAKEPQNVRRAISLTGQYAAVDELMTGRENMEMIGKLLHVEDYAQRADDLLSQFNLQAAADRRSGNYSGGMRRRLDIAMSLIGDPQVLFLDEPTTGLDPQNRRAMWREIEKLRERGMTVFLTTQYLEEAEELADLVAILDRGKITAKGTVAELKNLLPGGAVTFVFDGQNYAAARALAPQAKTDEETFAFTVTTDGSVDAIAEWLLKFKEAGIPVKAMQQEQATLEEVFLYQIGERSV